MTNEARRILTVLAKYKVSLPVAAYEELGLIEPLKGYTPKYDVPSMCLPPPTMDYSSMMHAAKRGDRVIWTASQVIEKLRWDEERQCIAASGVYTVGHRLSKRPSYNCTIRYGKVPPNHGNPRLLPREILSTTLQLSLYGALLPFFHGMAVTPTVEGSHRGHRCHLEERLENGWWLIRCFECKQDAGGFLERDLLKIAPHATPPYDSPIKES